MAKKLNTSTVIFGLGQGGSKIAKQTMNNLYDTGHTDFNSYVYSERYALSQPDKAIRKMCPHYSKNNDYFFPRRGDFQFVIVDVDNKGGVMDEKREKTGYSAKRLGRDFQGYETVRFNFKAKDTGNSQIVGRQAYLDAEKRDEDKMNKMFWPFKQGWKFTRSETRPENIMLVTSLAGGTGSSVSRQFTDTLVKKYKENSIINLFGSLPEGLEMTHDDGYLDSMPGVGQYFVNSTQFLGKGISAQYKKDQISAIRGYYLYSNMNPQKVCGEKSTVGIFKKMNSRMGKEMITLSDALAGRSITGLSNLTVQELKKNYGIITTGFAEAKKSLRLYNPSELVRTAFSPCNKELEGLSTYKFTENEIGKSNLTREFANKYVEKVFENIKNNKPNRMELNEIPMEYRANQITTLFMVNEDDLSFLTENKRGEVSKAVRELFPLKTGKSREYYSITTTGPTRVMGLLSGTIPSELLFTTVAGLKEIFNYDHEKEEQFDPEAFHDFIRGDEKITLNDIIEKDAIPKIDEGMNTFSSLEDREFYTRALDGAKETDYILNVEDVKNISTYFRQCMETAKSQMKTKRTRIPGDF